ncbi:leucine-rich repeat-containing protein 56 [Bombyx mandarina]|uniref:Leucine-rich repeat-containing protein 56 n=1 Tax=Bombyx mandarina TaxID=7092 RepID=A0A6J2K812_BOMMA|nr:leucine-rich repeat-containing protein 56 [Bombyx mandarina]XP_028038436.1 leucine-rich repeat-containing protein 56 [Bombyx mandarina]XP_028038437.1 leucine-rich repeat-containing protein 56 [Bombyx mandarina]XP_028038438.1 leucine-rich repeat-containing protein 56 [Bombyx mandarina]
MPLCEAPRLELGSAPQTPSVVPSPSSSEISSASSPEPPNVRTTSLFRALAMPLPEPEQPPGQEDLERRLPGYRRIVIPRELTLIELLKQSSGVSSDEEVLRIREAKLRVIAERVGLRRLHVLAPRLRSLILDGSALSSLRDLGIGLVHLKVLSVNRCGLTSLDGVWGLGALRELNAAGNRLHDLQPLGALQKLHTLNMADNPIVDSTRLWTLGVCGSLRRLTLQGTPVSECPQYRPRVAAVLPMLVYLDERPLHRDIEYDSEGIFGPASSSSDSEESDASGGNDLLETSHLPNRTSDTAPKNSNNLQPESSPEKASSSVESDAVPNHLLRRRPATTEGAGARSRTILENRPKTATDRPSLDAPTKLEILNTLMDKEWRCSGSKLTSHGAVCGNLARSLRRLSANSSKSFEIEKEIVEETMEEASRAIAAEIPRAPCLEDWMKFKEQTGIEIDIDFNERPRDVDPLKAIERLEQIERETIQRLDNDQNGRELNNATDFNLPNAAASFASCTMSLLEECELWRAEREPEPNNVLSFEEFSPRNMTSRNHYESEFE